MYRYISSKTDLLVMACEDIYRGVRDQLGGIAAGPGSVTEKLRTAFDAYMRSCWTKRPQIAMMYREYRRLPESAQQLYKEREAAIVSIFADLVRAGIHSGELREVDPTTVAVDLVYLGHMPAFKWWALRDSTSADDLHSEQADLMLLGLQARGKS